MEVLQAEIDTFRKHGKIFKVVFNNTVCKMSFDQTKKRFLVEDNKKIYNKTEQQIKSY
jgi:hypothetical protein